MNDATRCKQIVFQHARTFALASRLLPREKRRGVYALYAFCRTVDDLVDAADSETLRSRARTTINALRARDFAATSSADALEGAVLRELALVVRRFAVPRDALIALLDGVECDLNRTRYSGWAELERYCQGVASSVGEMCTAVFGLSNEDHVPDARAYARTLGLAMQLTNILRDVGEDARRGRCYLPDEDLDHFGLVRADVLSLTAHRKHGWRDFMMFEIGRARELYGSALPGIALLAADARRCAAACAAGYASILGAIEANDCDTITRRAVVAPLTRARVLVRSCFGLAPRVPSLARPLRNGDGSYASHVAA